MGGYKSQEDLKKIIQDLLLKAEPIIVDTNVESFQFRNGGVVAMDRASKLCVNEFLQQISKQRIDNIFLGVRDDEEEQENDHKEPIKVYEYVKRDCDEILPRLYLGSAQASKRNEFDCVINFDYIQTHWHDHPDQLLDHLAELTAYIHERLTHEKKVLVHCEEGKSRSASLVIAYLLTYRKSEITSLADALNFVRSKRPMASPNQGFLMQLGQLVL